MADLVVPANAPREEWLAARQLGIGASEIAAVLGLSPWQSPFSLFWEKQGMLDDLDDERLYWGRALEQPIALRFAEQHDATYVVTGDLYRSTKRPWQIATPDRLLFDRELGVSEEPISVLECKTSGSFDGWGDEGTDEIPVYYRCQLQQQMDVLDLGVAYVACLFSGRTYREYVVERDEQDLEILRERGAAFWDRVMAGDPPDVDWSDATRKALKHLHPDLEDRRVEVPAHLAKRYAEACDLVKQAEQVKALAENEVRELVGNARYATCGTEKVATRVVYDRTTVDTKKLRAEHPDAYAACRRPPKPVDQLRPASAGKKPKTIREAVA